MIDLGLMFIIHSPANAYKIGRSTVGRKLNNFKNL